MNNNMFNANMNNTNTCVSNTNMSNTTTMSNISSNTNLFGVENSNNNVVSENMENFENENFVPFSPPDFSKPKPSSDDVFCSPAGSYSAVSTNTGGENYQNDYVADHSSSNLNTFRSKDGITEISDSPDSFSNIPSMSNTNSNSNAVNATTIGNTTIGNAMNMKNNPQECNEHDEFYDESTAEQHEVEQ